MDINNKMLMDLASQLGLKGGSSSDAKKAAGMAQDYQNKSEEELMKEILTLKKAMKSDKAAFDNQMKAIRALSNMMNKEQRARLEKVIRLLEND